MAVFVSRNESSDRLLGVSLQPGEQTVVMWDHAVSSPGDYRVQFSVWESAPATAQNLLDQEPTAPQVLIAAAFAPTPSPTPQATPSAVPTPVSSPTPIATPTEPGAEIVSHGPSTVQFVQVGQSVFLSATIRNTRSVPWQFIVRARVTRSDGTVVTDYVQTLATALQPGQETTVGWTHVPQGVGDLFLQFSVGKDPSFSGPNLLDAEPSPPALRIKVQSF